MTSTFDWGGPAKNERPAALILRVDEICGSEVHLSVLAGASPVEIRLLVALQVGQTVTIPSLSATLTIQEAPQ